MMDPMTMTASPDGPLTWVSTASPPAAKTRPAPTRYAAWILRAMTGTTMEPATNAAIEGTVASPARSGDSASTNCRYCVIRSEEHTSELQSPCNLVCRLLLEKKKKRAYRSIDCRHVAHAHLGVASSPTRCP